jgi:hypothetical protein
MSIEKKYYTPTSREKFVKTQDPIEFDDKVKKSKAIRRLTGALLDGYSQDKQNPVKVFHNGDDPRSPRTKGHKEEFEPMMAKIVAERCGDLFDEAGSIIPERSQEWSNVLEIAPMVHNAFLKRGNYIDAVARNQSINLAVFSINVARNPELLGDTLLNVAFGGSDNEYATTRLPAYALPAIKIVRELKSGYDQRESKIIANEREQKVYKDITLGRGEHEIEGSERGMAYKEAKRILAAENEDLSEDEKKMKNDSIPTAEEMDELRRRYGIPSVMPSIQYFFAGEAAAAINHNTMDPEKIRARTEGNINILREYIETHHSDVAEHVRIVRDVNWDNHTPYAQMVIEYLADIVNNNQRETIKGALETLEKHGENHGGLNGRLEAGKYAATHPLEFGDRIDLPGANYVHEQGRKPKMNITIGGSTEERFWALREELSEKANSSGLKGYIDKKIETTGDEDVIVNLERMKARIGRWEDRVGKIRAGYTESNSYIARPDRP